MKIKSLLILLSCIWAFGAKAQFTTIGVGPEVNFPSGNSSNISGIGGGAAIKAEVGLSQKFGVTINGGVTQFVGKRYFNIRIPAETSVPLKGGFKYYGSEIFYVEGQLGANIPVSGNASKGFVWSPGVGTYIKMRNSDNLLDIGLRYEGWSSRRTISANSATFSTFNFVGIRFAYVFNLQK